MIIQSENSNKYHSTFLYCWKNIPLLLSSLMSFSLICCTWIKCNQSQIFCNMDYKIPTFLCQCGLLTLWNKLHKKYTELDPGKKAPSYLHIKAINHIWVFAHYVSLLLGKANLFYWKSAKYKPKILPKEISDNMTILLPLYHQYQGTSKV